jgi:hypothetical protein
MNRNDLPPLPVKLPLLPPGLFGRWFWIAMVGNLFALSCCALASYWNRGSNITLAFNVATVVLCLNTYWKIGCTVVSGLREWRHLRASYAGLVRDFEQLGLLEAELHEAIKEREAQHAKH